MAWWIWIVIGLIIISIEVLVSLEFFLFLIGSAGVLTGLIIWVCGAFVETQNLASLHSTGFFVFAISSVLLIFFARGPLKRYFAVKEQVEFSTGTVTITGANIAPNALGKGEMRGANCQVHNMTASSLIVGQSYSVSAYDGIILIVK